MDSIERKMVEAVQPLVRGMSRDMGFWAPEIFPERLAAFIGEVIHVCARTASEGEPDSPEETETPEAQRRRAREAVLRKILGQSDVVVLGPGRIEFSDYGAEQDFITVDLTYEEMEAVKGLIS